MVMFVWNTHHDRPTFTPTSRRMKVMNATSFDSNIIIKYHWLYISCMLSSLLIAHCMLFTAFFPFHFIFFTLSLLLSFARLLALVFEFTFRGIFNIVDSCMHTNSPMYGLPFTRIEMKWAKPKQFDIEMIIAIMKMTDMPIFTWIINRYLDENATWTTLTTPTTAFAHRIHEFWAHINLTMRYSSWASTFKRFVSWKRMIEKKIGILYMTLMMWLCGSFSPSHLPRSWFLYSCMTGGVEEIIALLVIPLTNSSKYSNNFNHFCFHSDIPINR